MPEKTCTEKIKDELLDTASEEFSSIAKDLVGRIIRDIGGWIINKYEEFKKPKVNKELELKKLQERIAVHNKTIEIGMEKEEIAVMWAMKKLGYTENETQKNLELVAEAYKTKTELEIK